MEIVRLKITINNNANCRHSSFFIHLSFISALCSNLTCPDCQFTRLLRFSGLYLIQSVFSDTDFYDGTLDSSRITTKFNANDNTSSREDSPDPSLKINDGRSFTLQEFVERIEAESGQVVERVSFLYIRRYNLFVQEI